MTPRLDWTKYESNLTAFARLGFNVLPMLPGFKHPTTRYRAHKTAAGLRITVGTLRDLIPAIERQAERKGLNGVVGSFLLVDSGCLGRTLCVVDVDGAEFDAQARGLFGESTFRVWRDNTPERIHRYFWVPSELDGEPPPHKIGLWGPGSVDVIGSTGVVLPGSVHASGGVYQSDPLAQLDAAPTLTVEQVAAFNAEHRTRTAGPRSVTAFVDWTPSDDPELDGLVRHFTHPTVTDSGNIAAGVIDPTFPIIDEDGHEIPLAELPGNKRAHSPFRDDDSPSCTLFSNGKKRLFFDWSLGAFWRVIDIAGEDPTLDLDADADMLTYLEHLTHQLTQRHNVEVVRIPARGYVEQYIPPPRDGDLYLVRAPHGSGKTHFSKKLHHAASRSVIVANTKALTISNAAALDLTPVYDDDSPLAPHVSTTANQLPRLLKAPDFFHVDEADDVLSFVTTSGQVKNAAEVFDRIFELAAHSPRVMFSSADLEFEDLDLIISAVRAKNPDKTIKVFVRESTRRRMTVRPLGRVKGEIHDAIVEGKEVFVGTTSRSLAPSIAWGYAAADLDANPIAIDDTVAHFDDPIDNPSPPAFDEVVVEQDADGVEPVDAGGRQFFVNGENNRYTATARALKDPNGIFQRHRLVCASPAIASGVSFTEWRDAVFVLHDNPWVPPNKVIQLAMRPRDQDRAIIGVKACWDPKPVDVSRSRLDADLEAREGATTKVIRAAFPDHEPGDIDRFFLQSWRIATRRLMQAKTDPVRRLVAAARRHGFDVYVDLPNNPDDWKDASNTDAAAKFRAITSAGRRVRKRANAQSIADAKVVEPEVAEQLQKKESLERGERQSIERQSIASFYELDEVSPELVKLDNRGRYRSRVVRYTLARLIEAQLEDVVAFYERRAWRGRTEHRHDTLTTALVVDLLETLTGVAWGNDRYIIDKAKGEERLREWYADKAGAVRTVLRAGEPKGFAAWVRPKLELIGAEVTTEKNELWISFRRVDELAGPYLRRLLDDFDRECKKDVDRPGKAG